MDRLLHGGAHVSSNAPRLHGFSYVGPYRYSLTFCTAERVRIFVSRPVVAPFVDQLLRTAAHERFVIVAYCFMPDHVHLLVEGLDAASDLREFVHRWKQASAFAWKQKTGGQLWQRGYYEHTLRTDEDTFAVARYVSGNPLRAGVVADPLEYPFIGSQTMRLRDLLYSVQYSEPSDRGRP